MLIPKDDGLEDFPMDDDEYLIPPDDEPEDEALSTEDDVSTPESVKSKPVSVWY